MVGIRSVTYQLPSHYMQETIDKIAKMSRLWDKKVSGIRTQRVSMCPFDQRVNVKAFKPLADLCDISSIRWFNVPIDPYHSHNTSELFNFAYSVLAEHSRAFVNVLGVVDSRLRRDAFYHFAELIRKVSNLSVNGKDNFRLGMSINVPPNGPFFPFSYSDGTFGFSIALELTQEINVVCTQSYEKDLSALRNDILETIVPQIEKINILAHEIADSMGVTFHGFDFSLAPVIGENGSIVTLLHRLGIYDFGQTGSLFATGYLTNLLKHLASRFPSVGFSGVMYSLLEDLELCLINNKRGVSLDQLIALSTMCGCGVDMVPVYGQVKKEELLSVFLDVAGVSCRLHKPLGVRILPIPMCGRDKDLFTNFHDDSDFIANTKVVPLNTNLIADLGESLEYLSTSS